MHSVSKLVFNTDAGHSTEVVALFDMELAAEGKLGARALHFFAASPQPERRDIMPGRRAGDVATRSQEAVPRQGQGIWWAALAAAVVLSVAATKFYVDRQSAAGPDQTLVVYTDPEDASATLDGEAIPKGEPVHLSTQSPTLTVEKTGFRAKTLQFIRGNAQRQVLRVTLDPD
jgi:hypothetical protein